MKAGAFDAPTRALQAWADTITSRPTFQQLVAHLAEVGVQAVGPPLLQPTRGQQRVIEWVNGSRMWGSDEQVAAMLHAWRYNVLADHLGAFGRVRED